MKDLSTESTSTNDSNLWLDNPTGKIPKGSVCRCCCTYNSRDVVSHALVVKNKKVLMVLRGHEPMKGWWGLPGGYIDWDESGEAAALRELKEETGVIGRDVKLMKVYSNPNRDKDGRQNVGLTYLITFKEQSEKTTPEEVEETKWFYLDQLPEKIAFDHRQMIEDYASTASLKNNS